MADFATCNTPLCDTVGLIITVLQLGQFIPQHYEMAVEKSVVGVSPWLLFFSSLYTYLAALDILLLDGPSTFSCQSSWFRCFIKDQPILQMVGSAFLSISMWYWYLKFYHRVSDTQDTEERKLIHTIFYTSTHPTKVFKLFIITAMGCNLISFLLLFFFGINSVPVEFFAYICGIASAGLNALMWIPQIIVTYQYGHKGALSILWVLASVIMDITYSAYLAFMGVNWTVWANNVPDGIQTGILLIMLLRFEYRDNQQGLDDFGHSLQQDTNDDNRPVTETKHLVYHEHQDDKEYLAAP